MTYTGTETTSVAAINNMKVEKVYERVQKDVTSVGLDGNTLISIDLGRIANLITLEGYCTTLGEKNQLKTASREWIGTTGGVITIAISYGASIGGTDTMYGEIKSLTITHATNEAQWKYILEIAEYLKA